MISMLSVSRTSRKMRFFSAVADSWVSNISRGVDIALLGETRGLVVGSRGVKMVQILTFALRMLVMLWSGTGSGSECSIRHSTERAADRVVLPDVDGGHLEDRARPRVRPRARGAEGLERVGELAGQAVEL
jgi:hypothetical protein